LLAAALAGAVAITVSLSLSLINGPDPEPRERNESRAVTPATEQAAERPDLPPRIERFTVGSGARAAIVVRPEGDGLRPAVIFLHGFGQSAFENYAGWIRHLARRGNTVIAPRYQLDTGSAPDRYLPDAIAGIRAALERSPVEPESLVVVGHSAGAALAVDYAAVAAQESLPEPRAVFAVYPGRALLDFPGGIPAEDESRIAPETRLVALAGAGDQVVGEGPAAEIVEQATSIPPERRELIRVTDPAVSDHYGPERSTQSARDAFWKPLDELIRVARRDG